MRFIDELKVISRQSRRACQLLSQRQFVMLALATAIMAITSGSNTAIALLLGKLLDQVKLGLSEDWPQSAILGAVARVLGIIALCYVIRELLHVVRRNLVDGVLASLSRRLLSRLVDHVLHLELRVLSHEKVGALHGRVIRSVDGLVRFVRLLFLDCLPAAFTGLFALGAALTKSPLIGLATMAVAPISVWLTLRQLSSQREVRLKLMRDCEEIDGTLVEQLNGAEYIRVANTYRQESQRLAKTAERKLRREVRHHFAMSLFGCGKALNEGACHVVVLAFATWLAVNGHISFGDILVFSVLFLNVMTPLNDIHRILDEAHESSLRVGDYFQMLGTPKDGSFNTTKERIVRLSKRAPAVEIKNLVVEYTMKNGKKHRALDGISLSIDHGDTIGIAGRSGCGKSSLVKVLLRLLHPASGEVLIGGVPLDQIGREQLARTMGYVGQVPFAISGSLLENIRYGAENLDPTLAIRASELAQLHGDILQLPGGYAAEAGERGQNLSGGQRQRLAIARVLLHGAPILILDEATSALDNISERYVQQALGVLNSDQTTILVAHRLSTLRDCDKIFVFEEGRIVEVGDFESLVRSGGVFAELVRSADERSPAAVTEETVISE